MSNRGWYLALALLLLGSAAVAAAVAAAGRPSPEKGRQLSATADALEKEDRTRESAEDFKRVRTWLRDADRAAKNKKAGRVKRLRSRSAAMLRLIEQRGALSRLRAEARRLERSIAAGKQRVKDATALIEQKDEYLKILRAAKEAAMK